MGVNGCYLGLYISEPDSSVSAVSGYRLDDPAIEDRFPAEARDFSSNLCVQTDSGAPTQLPVKWVLGVKRGHGVKLTSHRHLVSRSWMSRSYKFSPLLRLHRFVVGLLYMYIYTYHILLPGAEYFNAFSLADPVVCSLNLSASISASK
jgi:hypothetical protein